jgi:hypothetical protein
MAVFSKRKTWTFSLIVFLVSTAFLIFPIKAETTQIYFGAYVGPSHKDTLVQLQAFETTANKEVGIWHWIQYWNRPKDQENSPYFETAWMDECRAHGSIPMITWDPEGGWNDSYINLNSIIQGNMDNYLRTWAQNAKAWGHPFFVRLFHEFNGEWTSWCEGVNGNTQGQFVQAWRHVVNVVRSAGETDITWVWSPNIQDEKGLNLTSLYPGDSYVDWTGMDGYNWGDTTSFSQVFSWTYNKILSIAPTKPMMIAEVGCKESNYKATFFSDMLNTQLPNNFGKIKAIVYWEGQVGGRGSTNALLIESNADALSAFKQGIASNYYSSNAFSSLSISPIPVSDSEPTKTSVPTEIQASPTLNPNQGNSQNLSFLLTPEFLVLATLIVLVSAIAIVSIVLRRKSRFGQTRRKGRMLQASSYAERTLGGGSRAS